MTTARRSPRSAADPLAGLSPADLKWPPGVGPGPVRRAYADGASLDQCARWFGITIAATAALLRSNGVTLRPGDDPGLIAPPPFPPAPAVSPAPAPPTPAPPVLPADDSRLLTTAEVAALLRVDRSTVGRWAKAGQLTAARTLGGHRRYRDADVRAFLAPGR